MSTIKFQSASLHLDLPFYRSQTPSLGDELLSGNLSLDSHHLNYDKLRRGEEKAVDQAWVMLERTTNLGNVWLYINFLVLLSASWDRPGRDLEAERDRRDRSIVDRIVTSFHIPRRHLGKRLIVAHSIVTHPRAREAMATSNCFRFLDVADVPIELVRDTRLLHHYLDRPTIRRRTRNE